MMLRLCQDGVSGRGVLTDIAMRLRPLVDFLFRVESLGHDLGDGCTGSHMVCLIRRNTAAIGCRGQTKAAPQNCKRKYDDITSL